MKKSSSYHTLPQKLICRKYHVNLRQEIFMKMNQTVEKQIVSRILLEKEGVLIFSEDFADLGTQKAVSKNLERLVDHNVLVKVTRGIYLLPKKDKLLGPIMPSMDEIARSIASREGARLTASGISALQQLGLSTQIPMNAVYFTDGGPKKIKVGARYLVFKRTTTKIMSLKGKISNLVVKAMKEIGKDQITEDQLDKLEEWVHKEDRDNLLHDVRKAPIWIRDLIMAMVRKNEQR